MWVKLWGTPPASGGVLAVHVVTLPTAGQLYQVGYSTDASTALPVTAANQALPPNSSYVMYVPEKDAYGRPHDSFQYAVRVGGLA